MGNEIVKLDPKFPGRAYVDKHALTINVGKTITFDTVDCGFVVVIPQADILFDADPTPPKTWIVRISENNSKVTPPIKSSATGNYEYHVFCEGEGDWAHKRGASPPKIIAVP